MNTLTVKVLVHKISHMFSADGSITPYINIYPPLTLPNGKTIYKFPLPKSVELSKSDIAPKDELEINISSNEKKPVEIKITKKSDSPRRQLLGKVCPICNTPLANSKEGIGRCNNRSCMAQMSHTIMTLLSSLGLKLDKPFMRILGYLLSRGSLYSPASIFYMSERDLDFPLISTIETLMFLQFIHSVRGNVKVSQLLKGLNIPDMSDKDIASIQKLFDEKEWSILELSTLCDESKMKVHTTINWNPWKAFIAIPSNLNSVIELSQILHV